MKQRNAFTVPELLLALSITAILMLSMASLVSRFRALADKQQINDETLILDQEIRKLVSLDLLYRLRSGSESRKMEIRTSAKGDLTEATWFVLKPPLSGKSTHTQALKLSYKLETGANKTGLLRIERNALTGRIINQSELTHTLSADLRAWIKDSLENSY